MEISCYSTKSVIEILMGIVMIGSLGFAIYNRKHTNKGIGARIIQFICVSFVIPAIVILSLEGAIDGGITGTLIGGVVGYVLSKLGEFTPSNRNRNNANDEE